MAAGWSQVLLELDLDAHEAADNPHPLDASPDADHSASGPTTTLTAGTNLVMGDACYTGSDGKMEKAKADAAATAACWTIALATIAENAAGSFALPGCFVRDDSWNWTTVGGYIYLSDTTAGAMTQTPPADTDEVILILGIAVSADVMYFSPQPPQVVHA